MDKDKMGKFIEQLRKSKGYSQNDLAKIIPIGREAISKWERGENAPSSVSLYRLCDIFEVTMDELMFGEYLSEKNEIEVSTVKAKIYDDNIAKTQKINILISFIIVLIISFFAICILLIYFVNTFDTVKVYTINCHNDEISIHDGLFFVTKEKTYLSLGKIEAIDKKQIVYTKLYYVKRTGEHRIISEQDDLPTNIYDYNEYEVNFEINDIDYILQNMLLEVTFKGGSSTILHLEFIRDFSNDYIFPNKIAKYNDSENENDTPKYDKKAEEKIKDSFSYESEGVYKFKKDNFTFNYFESAKSLIIYLKNTNSIDRWSKQLFLNDNTIIYFEFNSSSEILNAFQYNYNDDSYECISNECKIEKNKIRLFIEETSFIFT